ncbi:MAG TPA: hypothetical protein VK762_03090 [Polyangiaceae bacterium]|jgi:hypothetical protein|nr:hypothetical protein [Polyangiaceae bacterium]
MRTVSSVLAVAHAVGFALALSSLAQAVPDPPLSYRAPDRCPTEEAFLGRLRSRLGPRQGPGSGRSLAVQITFGNGRYAGQLSLVEVGGRSTTKTLSDADCEELVDALALVAALALETDDRDAGTGSAPPGGSSSPASGSPPATAPVASGSVPASPSATASSVSPPVGVPGSLPAPTEGTSPAPPAPDAHEPSPAHEASGPEAAPAPPPRLGLGLSGLVTTGPAPRPLLGGALTASWMPSGTGAFRPVLEIGGAVSASPDAPEAKGTAGFTWLTAHAVAYLLQWPPGPGALLRGGLAGDFGALLARGSDTTSPASSSRPWASLGGIVGVEVPAGRFAVRVSAAVEAPLRRDRYAFGSTDFFEVPDVIATGAVSVVAYAR